MSLRFAFLGHVPLEESAADAIVYVGLLFGQYTCHVCPQYQIKSLL